MSKDNIDIDKISYMTDDELLTSLTNFGESVEPITVDNRNIYEEKLKNILNCVYSENSKFDCSAMNTKEQSQLEPVSQHKVVDADIFYGVFIPSQYIEENEDVKHVYSDKSECLAILRRYQGARFKGFSTYNEALCFSEYGPIVSTPSHNTDTENESMLLPSVAEKPSPFRGPKSQELVKFRKAIEKGNSDYFDECVKSNPRFLVSSGDTPAILQEGSRYNALHIACRNNKPDFCCKILSVICNPELFQRLYPDDSLETSERRSGFLLDLYLNTPDKGLNETPLHFACKHGSLECAKHLLSYSACDKTRFNKYNQTPRDIICSRLNKADEKLSEKLKELFEEQYFVPVLRDEDNCLAPCIGSPWSPLHNTISALSPSSLHSASPISNSPISPMFKVRGYAGPMSPQRADLFYSRWKKNSICSPAHSAKEKIPAYRITDHEKGLERVGRNLASEYNVEWAEYWNFLNGFVNVSSMDGLQKLEHHLKMKYKEVIEQRNVEESDHILEQLKNNIESESSLESSATLCEQTGENLNQTHSTISSIGELCQDLEALRLNVSVSPNLETQYFAKTTTTASLKRKHSYTKSHSCSKRSVLNKSNNNHSAFSLHNTINSNDVSNQELIEPLEDSYLENEHYNFAVQSTRISAQRLSVHLGEISLTISSHIGPDFYIARTLRNKIKPEVESLRMILSKFNSLSSGEKLDFGFVHAFLAAKTIENVLENISASNLYLISETLKLLVGNMESFDESSSDDENTSKMNIDEVEREGILAHFRCILRKLEKSSFLGVQLMKEGNYDCKINLSELEDCECSWRSDAATAANINSLRCCPVDTKPIINSLNNKEKKERSSSGRFSRAHSFLRRILFKEDTDEKDKYETRSPVVPVFKNVRKNLSFEERDNEEEEEVANDEDTDNESFTSAVSSFEDDGLMATPEQEVQVFINGFDPSKDDSAVFVAIEGLSIDENVFPHVSQWLRLMESYSAEIREKWPSCRHHQQKQNSFVSSSPNQNHVRVKKQLIL